MFELIAFLALFAVAACVVLCAGLFLKLVFKIVLFPVWLAIGLVKLVGGLVAAVAVVAVCVALAPLVVLLVLFVGLPLLALFGFLALLGLGGALVAA